MRDMQERIAVMFAAWASAMAGSGRSEELHAALASVVGEERARIAMDAASLVAPAAVSTAVPTDAPAAKPAKVSQAGAGKRDPRQDRLLVKRAPSPPRPR